MMMTFSTLPLIGLASLDGVTHTLAFLVMLSVLIVLHEGGHFLVARWNGVRVNDFALGMGPTLLKWTSPRSGTNYRLNLLPIGGYCAMQGEDGKTSEAEQQRSFRSTMAALDGSDNFQSKTPLQRLEIVLAGPIANIIVTFVILVASAVAFGIATDANSALVGQVKSGSPGARAGLQFGDRIVSIDGDSITSGKAMVERIHRSANVPLTVRFERHGEIQEIHVTPEPVTEGGKTEGRIGFAVIPKFERVGLVRGIQEAWFGTVSLFVGNIAGVADLIMHPADRFQHVSGVIGMGRAASQLQDLGWAPYLQLAAGISMALGIFNLLPIPALDGGRAIFILAEMLRGKPVDPEREAFVHVTGFALLMVLMIFVAYHDIANLVAGKGVF
jgi:regulator of sigma E protease